MLKVDEITPLTPSHLQVKEGGYDYKVNETVSVVTSKTTEIGHRTWGIVKGVMALAAQKVEELSNDGMNSGTENNTQQNDSRGIGYHQDKQENKNWNSTSSVQSSTGHNNAYSSSSWDDWDAKEHKKDDAKETSSHSNDGWAGWGDEKDDGFDEFYEHAPDHKSKSRSGKSNGKWTDGGFV